MESLKMQTTLLVLSFCHPFSLMNWNAACITDPEDPPTSKPSFWMRFLALVNDGKSSVLTQ